MKLYQRYYKIEGHQSEDNTYNFYIYRVKKILFFEFKVFITYYDNLDDAIKAVDYTLDKAKQIKDKNE